MKVLFLEVPKQTFYWFGSSILVPVPFLHLAAYLQKHTDYEVVIRDCRAEKLSWEDVPKVIKGEGPQVVCLTGFTPECYSVYRGAFIAKTILPKVKTITGGQHFTWTPEQSLRECSCLDYIVRREGEASLLELLRAIEDGKDKDKDATFMEKIKGIAFLNNGTYVQTPDRPLIEDIDSLPLPAYHLVNMDLYRVNYLRYERGVFVFGSRGCTGNCEFCTTPRHWGRWRPKSAKLVADEVELLVKKYHKDSIWFIDDCFNISRERDIVFCEEIIKRKIKVEFWMETRTDQWVRDKDLIPLWKRAGLKAILTGIEFSSDGKLKEYKKGTTVDVNTQACRITKKAGLTLQTCFMYGDSTDDGETAGALLKYARKMNYDLCSVQLTTPFPGTVLYDKMKEQGRLLSDDWLHYALEHSVIKNDTCSPQEIEENYLRINFTANASIGHFLKMLFQLPRDRNNGYWSWRFYWETSRLFIEDFFWGLLHFKIPKTWEDFATIRIISKRYIPALRKKDWEKIRQLYETGKERESMDAATNSYLPWVKAGNSKYEKYKQRLLNNNNRKESLK